MHKRTSSIFLYAFLALFIAGWWSAAFRATSSPALSFTLPTDEALALKTSALFEALSPLQRNALQQALAGNYPLMLDFIEQWNQDAALLIDQGVENVRRLPHETQLQAHLLGRLIFDSSPSKLRQLNCRMNLDSIHDDHGSLIEIEDTFERFIPQSYVAATFLLAIAQPKEILALPKGLRYLPQLYDPLLLARIPGNINRMHGEMLSHSRPDLAFVAPYSHPPALEAFRNQGIKLYTLKYIDTLKEIQTALLKVGHTSNHILEAQLLAIFVEASLLAIDNRLAALHTLHADYPKKLLYLFHRQHYMLPTTKSLTGQLMARLLDHCPTLSCPLPESSSDWRLPFTQEQILQANPDCLIISTASPQELDGALRLQPGLQQLAAYQSQRIFAVDESVQESPTQYMALAYFDLFQAVAAAHCL